jgi:hypothetical protein
MLKSTFIRDLTGPTMSNEEVAQPCVVKRNLRRQRQIQFDARQFEAKVLSKQEMMWGGGKAVLIDHNPHAHRTDFKHCLRWHTLALHAQGANSQTELRYDGDSKLSIGGTLGRVRYRRVMSWKVGRITREEFDTSLFSSIQM